MLETTAFGRTGFEVTGLSVGTSSWGTPRAGESTLDSDARVMEMATAFASGTLPANFLDTSNIYGGSRSEELIGRAFAEKGGLAAAQASGLVIQTKLDRDVPTGDFSGDRMWRSLEESLARLGGDHLQVLHLHDPENIGFDAAMAPGGPVEALVAMKEQGIVDAIGISGGPVAMLQQFVETDHFDALVTHNRFTLVDRSAGALFDAATSRGVGITNAAPWGAGVLTGDPRFADTYGYRPITPEVRASVASMRDLCDDAGVSLSAAALQFSLRDPRVHATIVGVSTLARLESAIDDATTAIPADLWAELDAVAPKGFALDA
jgi:D-threo-aldose 1-dehydrogenase